MNETLISFINEDFIVYFFVLASLDSSIFPQ